MGMIDRFLTRSGGFAAAAEAAGDVAEIFTPNATRRMELDEEAYARAITQAQAEFSHAPQTWWDSLMNGLNRLPRPLLTLGTIGLFIYAMIDPPGFSMRMEGLALVPEPLWWLMGAIVSFYFGAREAHYFRRRVWPRAKVQTTVVGEDGWRAPRVPTDDGWRAPQVPVAGAEAAAAEGGSPRPPADDFADNPALRDWAQARG